MPSTMKTEIHQPSELYDAIVTHLQAEISAGDAPDVVVSGYEDWSPAAAADRQILVEMSAAEEADKQADGRHAQQFEIVLYAVISRGCKQSALQAMNLASVLMRVATLQSFGFSGRAVHFPQKMTMEASFLVDKDERHQGFEAWEVRWRQQVNLGLPQFEDDPELTGIWLAVNPDDPDDINEYSEVTDACLNSSITEQIS